MNKNPICWFEIYVDDMNRATAFYEAMLQVKLEDLPMPQGADTDDCEGSVEMKVFTMEDQGYGATGALVKTDHVKPGPGGSLVYFTCDDCAVEAARAAENGGTVINEKMSIGEHGYIAMVNDTEGNMIGLHSQQ